MVYSEPSASSSKQAAPELIAMCESVCEAFTRATGATLQFSEKSTPHSGAFGSNSFCSTPARFSLPPIAELPQPFWSTPIQATPVAGHIQLTQGKKLDAARSDSILELAQLLGDLLNGFYQAHSTSEALACELAAIEAMPSKRSTVNLGERLQSVLKTMVETLHCTAAGMYVLDDATSLLQLRTMWGLPVNALTAEPRILETAKADLEAMLGHAVVLSNRQMFELWQVPEMDFEAAVCVPLATTTTVLGTVWLYHAQERSFTDSEVNLIEVLTGRLAMELEYAISAGSGPVSGRLDDPASCPLDS